MPPLFMLAPPRSFTSVTCAMLGCHPQMFGLAEIKVFAGAKIRDLSKLHKIRKRLPNGLLRSIAQIAFGEQTEETIEAARSWLDENRDMSTSELFRTMMEWLPDRTLIDKSPLHVFRADALERMRSDFPEAYFLHLTRHPGDTVKSMHALLGDMRKLTRRTPLLNFTPMADLPVEEHSPEKLWLNPHRLILEMLEGVPEERKMRMRGEDLLSEPRKHLALVAAWLGKRTDEEAVEAMLHPENSPFACYGPPNARFGNDPSFMERPALRPYSYEPHPLVWQRQDGSVEDLGHDVRACAEMFGY
jgi:hypothetical protein